MPELWCSSTERRTRSRFGPIPTRPCGLAEPVLLDEWQLVPGVLGAVKRSIDSRPDPGRFIVTGSVRSDLEAELWPGTGRLTRVPMYGMTLREQLGEFRRPAFLDRVSMGDELQPAPDTPDLRGCRPSLELAMAALRSRSEAISAPFEPGKGKLQTESNGVVGCEAPRPGGRRMSAVR